MQSWVFTTGRLGPCLYDLADTALLLLCNELSSEGVPEGVSHEYYEYRQTTSVKPMQYPLSFWKAAVQTFPSEEIKYRKMSGFFGDLNQVQEEALRKVKS